MRLHLDCYERLEFASYHLRLSSSDPNDTEKYAYNPDLWTRAERICIAATEEMGIP